jgi:hypothetical protein
MRWINLVNGTNFVNNLFLVYLVNFIYNFYVFRTYIRNSGSEREGGHHRYHSAEKTTIVWPRQKDTTGQNTKINCGLDTRGEKEKRASKKNVDGRSTSSHYNKKFRTRSMEKQRGMEFGFRKTATTV